MSETLEIGLPQYISHKKVWALKIAEMKDAAEFAGVTVRFVDSRYAPMRLSYDWHARVKPGDDLGYWVRYADGFESWSPTKAFEEGYTLVGGDVALCRERGDEETARQVEEQAQPGDIVVIENGEAMLGHVSETGDDE